MSDEDDYDEPQNVEQKEATTNDDEDKGGDKELKGLPAAPDSPIKTKPPVSDDHDQGDEELLLMEENHHNEHMDEKTKEEMELIRNSEVTTPLEQALSDVLKRKDKHIALLTNEITKLKAFISKRKQTYKRKRKDEGAPTRALSAYNIFIQDRFRQLAKENEKALRSADTDAQLKRVPPANLVAATGNQWKDLPLEEKAKYEERAKSDRERFEKQMAEYQPPDKQGNRKRNKTGYNMVSARFSDFYFCLSVGASHISVLFYLVFLGPRASFEAVRVGRALRKRICCPPGWHSMEIPLFRGEAILRKRGRQAQWHASR